MPRVSVTIPAYNHEKYVAEAIQSVLDQTYQDFEIVITNDGSTDRTVDEIEKFTDPRIKLFSFEKNRGFISADNNCIRNATGEYIAELSSDDMFLPHKLEKQVKFLDEHPDIGAVFGYPYLIDEDGNDFADVTSFYYHVYNQTNRTRHEWLNYFFYKANCLAHPSVLIRRECLDDIGHGDERFVQLPDLDLWIRLCMKYAIHILPEKVFKFRIRQGGANLSGDRVETRIRDLWEHEQVLKHFLHIKSIDELCKIFPQMEKYGKTLEDDLIPFFIAELALKVDSPVHKRFALGVLFDLLSDRETARKLSQKYGFIYRDLIKLTGQTDIYNFEIVRTQRREIESLKALEDQQRREIENLKALEDQQRRETENLKALEERQRREIENLKALEEQQRREIENLKGLEERQRREIIDRLREMEKRQRDEIESLKTAAEGQSTEVARLKTIEDSLSWRIVRKCLDIFDRLFRRSSPGKSPAGSNTVEPIKEVDHETVDHEAVDEEAVASSSIVLQCDRASIMFDTIDIAGWAIASEGIEKVEVYCNNELLGNAIYGQPRPDVQNAYPLMPDSDKSGFFFFGILERARSLNGEDTVLIRAVDKTNQHAEKDLLIKHEDYYSRYLMKTSPAEGTLQWMREVSEGFRQKPVISFVLVVNGDPLQFLERSLETIKAQTYPLWEIVLFCENESMNLHNDLEMLIKEGKLKVRSLTDLNKWLREAEGEFVAFLSSGDLLAPHALFEMVKRINMEESVDLMYCDEDTLVEGQRKDSFLKPDWSPDLLLSMNYIGNFFLLRKKLFDEVGGLHYGFTTEGIYDLLLRATERTDKIVHVPCILTTRGDEAGYISENTKKVLKDALVRRNLEGDVIALEREGTFRVKRNIVGTPKVSIIIPTAYKNPEMFQNCLTSILEKSTYRNYEIIIIDHTYGKLPVEFLVQLVPGAKLQILPYEDEFNFSSMNNRAVTKATGEYFIFLNDDTEVITPGWIEAMLEHAQRSEVGVVGVKLHYPDDTIQHAGMFLVDHGGGARHAFRFAPKNFHGYQGLLGLVRNCSSVTFACAMVSRDVFRKLGGLDENLRVECNDLDFCLRAGEAGFLIVWTPFACLYHKELTTRITTGFKNDIEYFWNRWRYLLEKGDPYYNPNLTLDSDNYSLNMRPVLITHHAPSLSSKPNLNYRNKTLFDPSAIKRILVVKLDHIGDVILCLPAVKLLNDKFPKAEITMLVGSWAKNIVRRVPGIDDVLTFDFFFEQSEKGKRQLTGQEKEDLAKILTSRKFDLAIDLRRHRETRDILKLSGAPLTAGYCTDKDDDDWLTISLEVPPEAQDIAAQDMKPHITAQLCELVLALNTDTPANGDMQVPALSIDGDDEEIEEYAHLFREECLIGIHPGAGNLTKQWPYKYFARLADLFVERNNAGVLIFGGKQDKDLVSAIFDEVKNKGRVFPLAGAFSLDEFMKVVAHCRFFVGNDSGPCHISGVMGIPTLAIFSGKVSPSEWHPLGGRSMSIRADVPCSPCYKALPVDCPFGLKCLTLLWPEKVWEAAQQILTIRN